ncbi:MAG TPA: hypothetical protein VFP61_03310 [Acidimicrobiales bacterium]|nr:hypothetical protein [Acidimicrobiales bacterium]
MPDETAVPDDSAVPSDADDRRRIAAAEAHLDEVQATIDEARAVDADVNDHMQSGMLPQARGDEGEGNAGKLRT